MCLKCGSSYRYYSPVRAVWMGTWWTMGFVFLHNFQTRPVSHLPTQPRPRCLPAKSSSFCSTPCAAASGIRRTSWLGSWDVGDSVGSRCRVSTFFSIQMKHCVISWWFLLRFLRKLQQSHKKLFNTSEFPSCCALTDFRCFSFIKMKEALRAKRPCRAWLTTEMGPWYGKNWPLHCQISSEATTTSPHRKHPNIPRPHLAGEVASILHHAVVLALGFLELDAHPVAFSEVGGAQESHGAWAPQVWQGGGQNQSPCHLQGVSYLRCKYYLFKDLICNTRGWPEATCRTCSQVPLWSDRCEGFMICPMYRHTTCMYTSAKLASFNTVFLNVSYVYFSLDSFRVPEKTLRKRTPPIWSRSRRPNTSWSATRACKRQGGRLSPKCQKVSTGHPPRVLHPRCSIKKGHPNHASHKTRLLFIKAKENRFDSSTNGAEIKMWVTLREEGASNIMPCHVRTMASGRHLNNPRLGLDAHAQCEVTDGRGWHGFAFWLDENRLLRSRSLSKCGDFSRAQSFRQIHPVDLGNSRRWLGFGKLGATKTEKWWFGHVWLQNSCSKMIKMILSSLPSPASKAVDRLSLVPSISSWSAPEAVRFYPWNQNMGITFEPPTNPPQVVCMPRHRKSYVRSCPCDDPHGSWPSVHHNVYNVET